MDEWLAEVGREGSARRRILEYLLAHVGDLVEGEAIRAAAGGITEWARRLRELRNEFGFDIASHKDSRDLKPGQYMLRSRDRGPVHRRAISKETRALVLERDGYTCQMCGLGAGDPDPTSPGRTVRIVMGHIIDKSDGGEDSQGNLRAICDACNSGLQNCSPPRPKRIELLKLLRRATVEDQLAALAWLKGRFERP